jgi:hypothetical protein
MFFVEKKTLYTVTDRLVPDVDRPKACSEGFCVDVVDYPTSHRPFILPQRVSSDIRRFRTNKEDI